MDQTLLQPLIWVILFKLHILYEVVIIDDTSKAHKILCHLHKVWVLQLEPEFQFKPYDSRESPLWKFYASSIIKNYIYSQFLKVLFWLIISTLYTMYFTTTNDKEIITNRNFCFFVLGLGSDTYRNGIQQSFQQIALILHIRHQAWKYNLMQERCTEDM